jgi:hypothetical protein
VDLPVAGVRGGQVPESGDTAMTGQPDSGQARVVAAFLTSRRACS